MSRFTPVGSCLRFPSRDVEFENPVYGVDEDVDLILVVLEDVTGENVVALAPDGRERWRIQDPDWTDDEKGYYVDAYSDDGVVRARSHAGDKYRIDPDTGAPAGRIPEEAVPVDGTTVPTALPVDRFFPRGDTTATVVDLLVVDPETLVGLPESGVGHVERFGAGDEGNAIVVLFTPGGASAEWETRNVVAFDPDGRLRWRIDAPDGDASGALEAVWTVGERVLVRGTDERTHELALDSGTLGRSFGPNELPVGEEVLEFPAAVGFATEREGVVVVFLDVFGDDDPPVPENRCLFGYDADGTELWQVDPLVEADAFTSVADDGDSIHAHSWVGKSMHLDWRTGELRLTTGRLW